MKLKSKYEFAQGFPRGGDKGYVTSHGGHTVKHLHLTTSIVRKAIKEQAENPSRSLFQALVDGANKYGVSPNEVIRHCANLYPDLLDPRLVSDARWA